MSLFIIGFGQERKIGISRWKLFPPYNKRAYCNGSQPITRWGWPDLMFSIV